MSADCATWRHQSAVAPATVGFPCTNSAGCPPPAASPCTSARTSARYWAVVAVHGAAAWDPSSSLSAIHGVLQSEDCWACVSSLAAAAGIVVGSAGSDGSPTIRSRWRTKYVVAAPLLR